MRVPIDKANNAGKLHYRLTCSICNAYFTTVLNLHYHHSSCHSTKELSVALLTLEGFDLSADSDTCDNKVVEISSVFNGLADKNDFISCYGPKNRDSDNESTISGHSESNSNRSNSPPVYQDLQPMKCDDSSHEKETEDDGAVLEPDLPLDLDEQELLRYCESTPEHDLFSDIEGPNFNNTFDVLEKEELMNNNEPVTNVESDSTRGKCDGKRSLEISCSTKQIEMDDAITSCMTPASQLEDCFSMESLKSISGEGTPENNENIFFKHSICISEAGDCNSVGTPQFYFVDGNKPYDNIQTLIINKDENNMPATYESNLVKTQTTTFLGENRDNINIMFNNSVNNKFFENTSYLNSFESALYSSNATLNKNCDAILSYIGSDSTFEDDKNGSVGAVTKNTYDMIIEAVSESNIKDASLENKTDIYNSQECASLNDTNLNNTNTNDKGKWSNISVYDFEHSEHLLPEMSLYKNNVNITQDAQKKCRKKNVKRRPASGRKKSKTLSSKNVAERNLKENVMKTVEKDNTLKTESTPEIINVEGFEDTGIVEPHPEFPLEITSHNTFDISKGKLDVLANQEISSDSKNNAVSSYSKNNGNKKRNGRKKSAKSNNSNTTLDDVICKPDILGEGYIHNINIAMNYANTQYDCMSFMPLSSMFLDPSQMRVFKREYPVGAAERRFYCECGKGYTKKSHLERHMRSHTGERPFACNHCQKQFAVRSILKQHIRTHTGEKPYSCTVCQQRFPQKSGLMTHMMLHTGKPFKCNFCTKAFVSNHKLQQHLRGHKPNVDHPCRVCLSTFHTIGSLVEHNKLHQDIRRYDCDICHESCFSELQLKEHIQNHMSRK